MQKLLENLKLGEGATSMVLWVGLSVILLVIVVSLAVWLVRTLRPNLNMGGGSGRGGRPQRLAITDAFNLDRDGRKLVIVRRDNTEHLLLIGGPNDVLIESGIIKNERALSGRERGRAQSEHDSALAAEAALSAELPRIDMPRTEAPAHSAPPVMSPPVMAPPPPPMPIRPAAPPPRPPVAPPPAPVVAPAPLAPPAPPPAPPVPSAADNVRLDEEFERALTSVLPTPPRPVTPPPAPAPVAPPVAPPQAMPAPVPAVEPAAPSPLPKKLEPTSEMARRLNEVLQKPLSGTLRAPFNKPIPPVPATLNAGQPRLPDSPPPPAQPPAPAVPPPPSNPVSMNPAPPPAKPPLPELPDLPPAPPPLPPRQDMQPAAAPKVSTTDSEMDLLEEEMARLLGRPSQPNKPGTP